MDLTALRWAFLEWVDDPNGDVFASGADYTRADALINQAYRYIFQEVIRSAADWCVSPTPTAINVTSAARSYPVTPATGAIHLIYDVSRVDGPNRYPCTVVPYGQRNRVHGRGISFYRDDVGVWHLVFGATAPAAMTLEVRHIPEPVTLAADTDVPTLIPSVWHDLIALRACVVGKTHENRDVGGPVAVYKDMMERMRESLGGGLTTPAISQDL